MSDLSGNGHIREFTKWAVHVFGDVIMGPGQCEGLRCMARIRPARSMRDVLILDTSRYHILDPDEWYFQATVT